MATINGKPSMFKSMPRPQTAILAGQRANSLRTWLNDLDTYPVESAETHALPMISSHGTGRSWKVSVGIVTETLWQGIYALQNDGITLAFLAETDRWHALIPKAVSKRLRTATDTDRYLKAQVFGIGGIPLLMSGVQLQTGRQIAAHIPKVQGEKE